LAAQLDLSAYKIDLYDGYSIQSCEAMADKPKDKAHHSTAASHMDFPSRIKGGALYAYVYVVSPKFQQEIEFSHLTVGAIVDTFQQPEQR
jgi:hypothetical protein